MVSAAMAWLFRRRFVRVLPSDRRSSDPSPTQKSFRIQLGLILLPVALLAGFALFSLRRDRAAVEEEARSRAKELAEDLAGRVVSGWPHQLNLLEAIGRLWISDGSGQGEGVVWRGDMGPTNSQSGVAPETMQHWRELYPLPPEYLFPIQIELGTNGDSAGRYAEALQLPVPKWTLAGKIRPRQEASSSSLVREPVESFVPSEVRAVREEWSTLSASTNTISAETRKRRLLALVTASVQSQAMLDSGLPVAVAAFAEFCRQTPRNPLDESSFAALQSIVLNQPSIASSWLMSQGNQLAALDGNAGARESMRELRLRAASLERRARLLQIVLSKAHNVDLLMTDGYWIHDGVDYWFVTQGGNHVPFEAIRTNTLTVPTLRILSEKAVGIAFRNAILRQDLDVLSRVGSVPRFPTGLKAEFTLAGHPVVLPGEQWTVPLGSSNGPVLAEEHRASDGITIARSGPADKSVEFSVRIHLSDHAALFQAQRRREWTMGLLILLTAGVAGEGARQAHRAFRWQLALNEQKSNFVSSVSHELRAPLASMRLLAEGLVGGRIKDDSKRKEYAGFLLQETRRLGALVDNVLDFARIEQGRKQYEFETVDAVRLVRETARLIQPIASEQQVRIEVNLAPNPEALVGKWDGPAVQRALLNLLDNALKHSPVGSAVCVNLSCDPHSGWLQIAVTDQGPGIPTEEQERIFERFYRRGSELRRETKGVGLGLAIVRHIVEAHGGHVTVASSVGHGARFTLELPIGNLDE